jgi:hypothetical protein
LVVSQVLVLDFQIVLLVLSKNQKIKRIILLLLLLLKKIKLHFLLTSSKCLSCPSNHNYNYTCP